MPAEPFRFVHAADLHLEQPLRGLTDAPEHLRAALIDAPYAAAERVFDAALGESADFLLLSGDVLNVHEAGPRAIVFLLEQFERLESREISVYWAGGKDDSPEQWPLAAKLPPNVHHFSRSEVEELTHYRHAEPLCRVAGISCDGRQRIRTADFHADPNGLFTIAVTHGKADADSLSQRPIDYWALGGEHQRQSLFTAPRTAHYAGTVQGRSPAESGPRGCTLVSIDGEHKVRTQFIAADAMRWHCERLSVVEGVTSEVLRKLLAERMKNLAADSPPGGCLVAWTIEIAASFVDQSQGGWLSRRAALAEELLVWLRGEFGGGQPPVWAASLDIEAPASLPPAWSDEDTILGDFLRAVKVYQADDEQPLNLSAYVSKRQLAGPLASATALADHATRRQVLREAAALGAELLRGEERI